MGRTVTTVDTAPVWYVPDIDDNRKDPEPFKVLLSPLTAGDLARAKHAMFAKAFRAKNEGDDDAVDNASRDMVDSILIERIVEVANYTETTAAGKTVHVKTGAELVSAEYRTPPLEEIGIPVLDDIWEALQKTSTLKDGVLGNSEGRPDSSEPSTSGAPTPDPDTASTTSKASAAVATSTSPGTPMVHESSETPGAARAS